MNKILCKQCEREFEYEEEQALDQRFKYYMPELCPDCEIDLNDDDDLLIDGRGVEDEIDDGQELITDKFKEVLIDDE